MIKNINLKAWICSAKILGPVKDPSQKFYLKPRSFTKLFIPKQEP